MKPGRIKLKRVKRERDLTVFVLFPPVDIDDILSLQYFIYGNMCY